MGRKKVSALTALNASDITTAADIRFLTSDVQSTNTSKQFALSELQKSLPIKAVIDTFASGDLQALDSDLADGSLVAVLGWTAVEDGGEGFVRYHASSTAAVDNGLTFDGLGGTTPVPGASTSTGTGRFTRVLEGNAGLDVKWFGAKGDGVADDTDAIQAAIAEVPANGGTVLIPDGTFAISAKIVLPENVLLCGVGRYASRISAVAGSFAGATDVMIEFDKRNVIRDLMVVCPAASGCGFGNDTTTTVWGVTFDNVMVANGAAGWYFAGSSWGIHLNNCYANGCTNGINHASGATLNALRVCHGEYASCGTGMRFTGYMTNLTIDSAIVQNNTSAGILSEGSHIKKQFAIRNCYFEDNGTDHVYMTGRTSGGVVETSYFSNVGTMRYCVNVSPAATLYCYGVTMRNNVSVARNDATSPEYDYVVGADRCVNCVVCDNVYRTVADTVTLRELPPTRIYDAGVNTSRRNDFSYSSISTVPTTDATVTTLATLATASDRVYHVRAVVFATETADHNEVASYELVGTFQNDGGTLTQVGSTSYVHFSETTNGWVCAFSVSSPNVLVRVTGAVATLVNWKCKLTWEELT